MMRPVSSGVVRVDELFAAGARVVVDPEDTAALSAAVAGDATAGAAAVAAAADSALSVRALSRGAHANIAPRPISDAAAMRRVTYCVSAMGRTRPPALILARGRRGCSHAVPAGGAVMRSDALSDAVVPGMRYVSAAS